MLSHSIVDGIPSDNSSNAVNLADADKHTPSRSSDGGWNASHGPGALVVRRALGVKCSLELADFVEVSYDAQRSPVSLPETSQAQAQSAIWAV
jgi:hypothetical protein